MTAFGGAALYQAEKESQIMFETTGVINEKLLKEIKLHIMPRSRKIGFLIGGGIFAVAAVVFFIMKNTMLAEISLLGLIVVAVEYYATLGKIIKTSLDKMVKYTGKPENGYTSSLNEEGLQFFDHVTGDRGLLKYGDFKKFIETESGYFLFTREGKFSVIFKDGSFEREELIDFLKSKPTQIAWK